MYLGKDHRVKLNACPSCDYSLDAASQLVLEVHLNGNALPVPGDFSISLKCGSVAVFDKQMNLRLPTAKEKKCIDQDQTITLALRAIFALHVEEELKKNLH